MPEVSGMHDALDLDRWPTACALTAALRDGALGARELLEATLSRIARFNPAVNAIVSLDAEAATATAQHCDALPAAERARRPLHGLPVAIKDLALTRDLRTTFGSPLFENFIPKEDELFVSRLRTAGAVIIGKTNTPEFGAGSQTFNPVFGATRNPYDLTRTCGGSSGGAAVALACGFTALADGSDLGGSLRNPAAFCNVLGMRPSPGRVPNWPKQITSDPLSVVGPMARNAEDAALLLSVMAGADPRVPISITEPPVMFREPLSRSFRGARIAWSPCLGEHPIAPEISSVLAGVPAIFEALGCTVHEATPDLRDAGMIFKVLRARQFALRFGPDLPRTRARMKDTVVWNVEQGLSLTLAEVDRAEMAHTQLLARVAAFFETHDFLICPATQVAPFPLEQEWVSEINGVAMQTYLDWMSVCWAITVTGCPALSVPAGFTPEGLPVGLQIVAPRWHDRALLQLAHAFETACPAGQRRPSLTMEH